MSNLHPGGQRTAPYSRIFGFDAIKLYIQRNTDPARNAKNSIAKGNRHGGRHEHKREIARNRRRQS